MRKCGRPFAAVSSPRFATIARLDALNTYLIFLRFELTRGALDAAAYQKELEVVEAKLAQSDRPHLKQYLELWQTTRHAG